MSNVIQFKPRPEVITLTAANTTDDVIIDAKALSESLSENEVLFVKYHHGTNKYHLATRTHMLGGTDWDYHFPIDLAQARIIVDRNFARWYGTVDEAYR